MHDLSRHDLSKFTLTDMVQCGVALRSLGSGAASLEEVACRVVRYFHDQFTVGDGHRPAFALVRCFKTHPYVDLPDDLRRFAANSTSREPARDTRCLTLLASAGALPDWNDRRLSRRHQAIPLDAAEIVERSPMVARLVSELGLDVTTRPPSQDASLPAAGALCNTFHVEEAQGAPVVPDQGTFVIPHGIRSVLGFGGLAPTGELLATILFSRVTIPPETAELFRTLALNIMLAMVPQLGRVFDEEVVPVRDAQPPLPPSDIETFRLRASQQLIDAYELAALEQGARLQKALVDLQARAETLEHQAAHDPLTGLANRVLLRDRLEHAMARSRREGSWFGLLSLDLDGFKLVNDTMGHDAGDELLVEVAERLRRTSRAADLVSRIGGDEFAVVLESTEGEAGATLAASRFLHAFDTPIVVRDRELVVGVSIGIAVGRGEQSVDEVLRQADIALYASKAGGRGRFQVFTAAMAVAAMERAELESEMRLALQRDEFVLSYQPVVRLDTAEPVGFEALIRWAHPRRGRLIPGVFLGVAEESGLIAQMDRLVLAQGCRQVVAWQERHSPDRPLTLSVNASPRHLQDPELVEFVRRTLSATGLAPQALTLEVTESALMRSSDETPRKLASLRELGVSIAIDDFGSGYSSLNHLRRLPVDVLKIDRSFIEVVQRGPDHAALAQAIVRLAQALDLDVVAEGIELAEQLRILRDWGCTHGQGYLFSPPLPAGEVPAFLAARTAPPAGPSSEAAGR